MTDWLAIEDAPPGPVTLMLGRQHPNGWVAQGRRSLATGRWLDDQGREFQMQPTHYQMMPEVPK